MSARPRAGGVVLLALAAGCGSPASDQARLDVTVTVDAALALDSVAITVSGGGRANLPETFTATPTVKWEIVISKVTAPFTATIQARGVKASQDIVTYTADAVISPGGRVEATLRLDAACRSAACTGTQTCSGGTCVPRPVFGQRDGGSTDAPADGRDGGGKKGNGTACAADSECTSNACAEGVCCNEACGETCRSCRSALTVSLADGTCGAVASSKDDPGGRCTAGTPESCGNTGHCNGQGACDRFGGTTTCAAATCSGGRYNRVSTCDGSGTCVPGTSTDCRGFACSVATGCATTCTGDADCPDGYCTTGSVCTTKKADGAVCGGDRECVNDHCVAGICCNAACDGICTACDGALTLAATGECAPVRAFVQDTRCVNQGGCGMSGLCNGTGACHLPGTGQACRDASCVNDVMTEVALCDGAGSCSVPASFPCPDFLTCDPGGMECRTSCADDADCIAGYACVGGTCTLGT